ncbi:hypothetical protein Tco_0624752 [Tanacetum coccineum]|uniref:Uncharacterized protein n=1 Tax=Tanacetum coccineum TaxID=301880 RepID=A0ABQ4WEU4_9ASTR
MKMKLFGVNLVLAQDINNNIILVLVQETDIQEKDDKASKNGQNRARNGKDKVKSKPKSVKVRKSTPTKSKVNQVKKIQLEGLKLPNLKLYYKNKKTRAEIGNWVLDQNVEDEKDAEFVAIEEVVEKQYLEIPTVEQLLDEVDKLNKAVQETSESPYDIKLEIKVVKSFFTHHISKLKDQTMHDSEETADIHEGSNSDLHSIPDDDMRSISGFHTAKSDDTHENKVSKFDHIFQDDNAFAKRLSLPNHMDHICEEDSSLYLRLGDMESSIVQQVSAEFKSSLPALVTDYLKEQLPSLFSDALKVTLPQLLKDSIKSSVSKSMAEELPHVEAQVQKNLQDQLPNLLLKPMYKEFNAFNKLESQRFVLLQKELTKSLHKNMKKSIKLKGEQPSAQVRLNDEKALVVHNPEEKKEGTVSMEDDSDEDDLDKQPLSKRFKIMTPIPNPIPQNTFFSPTPPAKPTPPRDPTKGKEVAIVREQVNGPVTYQEEGGSIPKMPKLKSFITPDGILSLEELNNQIKELKRISDLKAQKDKSEQELRKMFNQATLKAQAKKYYTVNSNKEATMKIIRGDNPLNLIVHPNFRLKSLGFSESLEVHALASKKTRKSNDMLLQSLRAKFQWVMVQAKKLGLPLPSALATAEEKNRKRTQFLKEAFVTEDIKVDGMDRNLIPPPGVVPIEGLVIKEHESGNFYMNRNTDIVFQIESKFHLTPTVMKGLSECKASESNIRRIRVKDIVKEVEDYLKTYSTAGMDISCYLEGMR